MGVASTCLGPIHIDMLKYPLMEKQKNKATPRRVSTIDTIEWVIECESCLASPWNRARGKVDHVHKYVIKRRSIMFQLLY